MDHEITKKAYDQVCNGNLSGLSQRILSDIEALRKCTKSGRAHLWLVKSEDKFFLSLLEIDLVQEQPPYGRVVIV
jgi:hypothetical protein